MLAGVSFPPTIKVVGVPTTTTKIPRTTTNEVHQNKLVDWNVLLVGPRAIWCGQAKKNERFKSSVSHVCYWMRVILLCMATSLTTLYPEFRANFGVMAYIGLDGKHVVQKGRLKGICVKRRIRLRTRWGWSNQRDFSYHKKSLPNYVQPYSDLARALLCGKHTQGAELNHFFRCCNLPICLTFSKDLPNSGQAGLTTAKVNEVGMSATVSTTSNHGIFYVLRNMKPSTVHSFSGFCYITCDNFQVSSLTSYDLRAIPDWNYLCR